MILLDGKRGGTRAKRVRSARGRRLCTQPVFRRLNKRAQSKTFGGRHAAATDGDEVWAQTSVNPSGGTPLDV